jgi:hypothetical protein
MKLLVSPVTVGVLALMSCINSVATGFAVERLMSNR